MGRLLSLHWKQMLAILVCSTKDTFILKGSLQLNSDGHNWYRLQMQNMFKSNGRGSSMEMKLFLKSLSPTDQLKL